MTRLYRLLLLAAYPRAFRDRFEAELVATFESQRREARYGGRLGGVTFWRHILVDLAISAARVRCGRARRPRATPPPQRGLMETIAQDLRHALRQLARRPAFAAVAVLSLALGIGGNTVIFAFVDGFVLHPFPYPDADRVVAIGSTFPRVSSEERFVEAISGPEFVDIREARSIVDIAAFDLGNRNISGGDRPERVFTALALTDLFAPFGLAPALGRGFTPEELAPGGPPVAIISHRLWLGRFGGRSSIVGETVRVNGFPTSIVGVMPRDVLVVGTDLWIPWGTAPASLPRNGRQLTLIGRLAPESGASEADAELAAIAGRTAASHGSAFDEYAGWRLSATPLAVALTRDIRPAMMLLLGAVGLVLLIACANLSNLLLARSTTRQREMAVRLALGAGRGGIARLVLAEVALLALAGGGGGLLVAQVGLPAIVSLVPAEANTIGVSASINGRVLAWTAAFTIGSALLVALLPVFQSTRTSPDDALKSGGRGASGSRAPLRLRRALIVAEIALSVVLLAGAGLLVRSFVNLQRVEPGFDPSDVLTMRLTLPFEKYRGAAINDTFQQILDRLDETPGVVSASAASQYPPQSRFTLPFRVVGFAAPGDTTPTALATAASAKHFATLGVPLVRGRVFTEADRANAPLVAVVNEAFAAQYLPGVAALGLQITVGPADRPSPPLEIVGVVANTQNRDLRNPPVPEIFVPLPQQTINNQLFLLVRTAGNAPAMLPAVRQAVAAVDPDQPVYAIRTLEEAIAADTFRSRFSMTLFAVFAAVALGLAALGIYGVMSYAVSARTKEIGVRLAVGAARRDVVWLVLAQVLRMTAVGVAIGLGGVLAASRLMQRTLFGVQATDPMTIAIVAVVLGTVALVAGFLPAWRASRVNPVSSLRYE
jgi:predicted permease